MRGDILMGDNQISGLSQPSDPSHVPNLGYVSNNFLKSLGGNVTSYFRKQVRRITQPTTKLYCSCMQKVN
jgi:hypothetical protein